MLAIEVRSVELVFESSQFELTKRTAKVSEFRSRVTGQFVYFEKQTGLPQYIHIVTDPRLEPSRDIAAAYKHSNMSQFPKQLFGGKRPIHYGYDHRIESLSHLGGFLEKMNATG